MPKNLLVKGTKMSYLQRLLDSQNKDLYEARSFLDRAESESRELTVEERTAWDALNVQMDARADHIASVRADEQRTADIEASLVTAPEVRAAAPVPAFLNDSEDDVLRKLASGEIRSHTFERRDLSTSSTGIIPSTFLASLQDAMVTVGPMVDGRYVTLLNTAGGEDLKIPVESARAASTAIAEATQIVATDPTLSSITLKSQKVAVLTKVSRELLTDAGIDLNAYLGRSMGTSVGIKANGLLTLGTGTVEAKGIVVAASAGGTGGTGVTGAFTADNLIDLAHSVDGAYVRQGAAWMMRRSTIGSVRKLKDTAGYYLFTPAATVGSPDMLLGYEIVDNPDVAAIGTSAKSVVFGMTSSYHVRLVGGIEVARSEDAYFDTDEVGFRVTARIWGDLGQSAAVKYFVGGTA